jgi:hypothetical protein
MLPGAETFVAPKDTGDAALTIITGFASHIGIISPRRRAIAVAFLRIAFEAQVIRRSFAALRRSDWVVDMRGTLL